MAHRFEGKTLVLLCLVSLVGVLAAAPQPPTRLHTTSQNLAPWPPNWDAQAPKLAVHSVHAEVWGSGQLRWRHLCALLRASSAPKNAHLRPHAPRTLQGAHWRLKSTARVSRLPQERRVHLDVRASSGGVQWLGSLEALDTELQPAAGFHKRMVRRFGPSAGVRWRPLGPDGQRGGHAVGACARLWPLAPAGPVWDLAGSVSMGHTFRRFWQPTLWAFGAVRGFVGGDDALLYGGDFLPGDALHLGAPSPTSRLLRTQVRGFEDATWYTTRQANLSVGLSARPTADVVFEVFSAAGSAALSASSFRPGGQGVRHASGAAIQLQARLAGRPILVRYQLALRHQGSRQPMLHMLTASL